MIDNTYPESLLIALRIAPVIAVTAMVAFAFRNRLLFVLGSAGSFAGLFFDRGGSTAGGPLDHAATRADSFLVFGVIGATIGILAAYAITTVSARSAQVSSRTHVSSAEPERKK